MKIQQKSEKEVLADLIGRVAELEAKVGDGGLSPDDVKAAIKNIIEAFAERDKKIADLEEQLNKKVLELNRLMRDQLERTKALAELMKRGGGGSPKMKKADLEYLAKVLIEGGFVVKKRKESPEGGIIRRFFK